MTTTPNPSNPGGAPRPASRHDRPVVAVLDEAARAGPQVPGSR